MKERISNIEQVQWMPDELEKREILNNYLKYKDYFYLMNKIKDKYVVPEELGDENKMLINIWLGGQKGFEKVNNYFLKEVEYSKDATRRGGNSMQEWNQFKLDGAAVAKAAMGDFDFAEKQQAINEGYDEGGIGECVIKNGGVEPAKRILKVIMGRGHGCGVLEISKELAKLGEKDAVEEAILYLKEKYSAEELKPILAAYSGNITECEKLKAEDFLMGVAFAKNNQPEKARNILKKCLSDKHYSEAKEIALVLDEPRWLRDIYDNNENNPSDFSLDVAKKIKGIKNELENKTPEYQKTIESWDYQFKNSLIKKAVNLGDKEFIKKLGSILSKEERLKMMSDDNISQEIKAILDLGKLEYQQYKKIEEVEDIFKDAKAGLKNILTKNEKNNSELTKYLTDILYNLERLGGDDMAQNFLLNEFREIDINHPYMARLAKTLAQMDSPKGKDLIVQMMGDEQLPRHYFFYFLMKLTQEGYLDKNLKNYLNDKLKQNEDLSNDEKIGQEEYLKKTIKDVISILHINPDTEVLKLILDNDWGTKIVGEIIYKIDGMRNEFEAIQDKDELVKLLINDKKKAICYYVLYGGKTHFELVNSYNSNKFNTILGVIDKLKYNEEPIKQLEDSLDDSLDKKDIVEKLKVGQFPFEKDNFVKEIRIDVSDSARYESLERESKEMFGSGQIGVILKYEYYLNELVKINPELSNKLKDASGLTDAETILSEIDAKYHDLNKKLGKTLEKQWKKIGEKNILSLSLPQVLLEKENSIDFNELFKNLEVQRKALMSSIRQQYKSGNLEKMVRDEKLEALEEKGKAKLLKFILQEVITINEPSEKQSLLLSEWESHLEGAFETYQELKSFGKKDAGVKKEKNVSIRYLDKRKDLIECLRFADSAQCCFTSTSYRLEGHNVGNAEWIARVWKDPLSFVFQIEDNEPNAKHRQAIGFVFGSFGLENGKPVVLLNGVYMKNKTDVAVASVLKVIEDNFSKLLKAKKQIVASRHGGNAKMSKEYKNDKLSLLRLRGLSGYNGKPETKIYDDLNIGVNEPNETDNNIWHKELKY